MPKIPSSARYLPGYDLERPDPRPGPYYVSVIDGRRYSLALGPFDTHASAISAVEPVRRYCNEESARAYFYAYGTARVAELEPGEQAQPGTLNHVRELANLVDADPFEQPAPPARVPVVVIDDTGAYRGTLTSDDRGDLVELDTRPHRSPVEVSDVLTPAPEAATA